MVYDERIIVFDVGARFGIHPSWSKLKNSELLTTYGFEPDVEEVKRLREKYKNFDNYRVFPQAFGNVNGQKTLNVLTHKGQSSFLEPNLRSAWFTDARKGEAFIESTLVSVMKRMDDWCNETGVYPDFIKTDTEGYDYFVLEGAECLLNDKILGIRCEVYFQKTFHGAKLFDQIFSFLTQRNFVLANIDYDGKGVAQSYFCPEPKYGLLTGCEAVFIRDDIFYLGLDSVRFLKAIIFLFLNDLQDLALRYIKIKSEIFSQATSTDSKLLVTIERLFLLAAKKLQYQPGESFDLAKHDFQQVFGKPFPEMHKFYESDFLNPA